MTATLETKAVPFFHGKITFRNVATGEHRTFQLRRQDPEAKFAPGKTILSLLTGSDNESDYTGFAFVTDDGMVTIWRKKAESPAYRYYAGLVADFLGDEDAEEFEVCGRTYTIHAEKRCAICGRTLTTPESTELGIGPICAAKGAF